MALHYRRNVDTMPGPDIAAFGRALSSMMALRDNRGYAHFASMHGYSLGLCKHHHPLFLPWHRAYLYMFELALRDIDSSVSLPWWDWSSDVSQQIGIPQAYQGITTLARAAVNLDPRTRKRVEQQAPWALDLNEPVPQTVRNPEPPLGLPTSGDIEKVLTAPSFSDFTLRLEDIHDGVHGWFKGSMALVPFAAYDPIFWAHHAMIDRLWYRWQLRNPGATMPTEIANSALEGFPLTVPQVLDIAALGYDYATGVV
jgi:tyrosinase